jgi:hypothetical protein
MHLNNAMKTINSLFLFSLVLAGFVTSGWSQSLNNTIWKGTATVKIPALTPYRDGVQKQYPAVVTTGLTFTIPVEAWFRTPTTFLIVLDQRAIGADPERAKLQPLIGSWTGVTYGSSNKKSYTGTYGSNKFKATKRQLVRTSWSYVGTETVQGSYRLVNQARMGISGTFTSSPNPSGPNGPKYSGGVPTFTAVLSKTARRPSAEIANAFSDTRGR